MKKRLLVTLAMVFGLLGFAAIHYADPVEYVKVCSLYGAGFHYIPGTDVCMNDFNGDTREQTEGGTWRTLLPYPEGKWVMDPQGGCEAGRLVKLGSFRSTDFTTNAQQKQETAPINLKLTAYQMITKVIMSGGFYDPRIPSDRHGANSMDGLCLRSIDPNLLELQGGGNYLNPPFGNGQLPIGCIANSRIVGMPAAYEISATSAYPDVDEFFVTADQSVISGPYLYGKQLVVSTDVGNSDFTRLTYIDTSTGVEVPKPLAGKLSVSVCVEDSRDFGR